MLPQPAGDAGQVALGDAAPHVHVPLHAAQHLGAVGAAQGVGREVAEGAAGPVGILQAAAGVVGHVHPEIFLVEPVPLRRDVPHVQGAADELLFDLIAHHHMQAVGQLVRLGADEGGLGAVDGLVELLRRHAGELLGEEFPHPGEDGLDEGQGAADDVLVEPGLALVDAHGHTAGKTGVVVGRIHIQLIPGVPSLVDDGVHGACHVVLLVMGGDAHVLAGEVEGEGVLRLADGAVAPVQLEYFHEVVGELPLGLDGVMEVEEAVVRLLLFADGADQGNQLFPDDGEEAVEIGHVHPALVLVEQGVVGGLAGVVVAGEFPVEGYQALQHRPEGGKVVVLLGPVPHVACLVGEHGILHVLVGGDARHLVVPPAQQGDLPGGDGVQLAPAALQEGEQPAHLGTGEQLVALPGQHAQSHAPALGGVLGGDGDAVQVQAGAGGLVGVHFLLELPQLLQGFFQFHRQNTSFLC